MRSFLARFLLLPSAVLAAVASHALAGVIEVRDSASKKVPAPIPIAPSKQWYGIDGTWSTFTVSIGTPPQEIQAFISWNAYQTWAVLPAGCKSAGNPKACAESRGGIYHEQKSSSFEEQGTYNLPILRDLGYYGNAIFGYDNVGIGGPNGVKLDNTTVAGFALEYFYCGIFGVNPKPTNFSSVANQAPSYMTLLKEQDDIPSISFGYTAGASYRQKTSSNPFAHLTLGGYDSSMVKENDLMWSLSPDNERDVVVVVQSIFTPAKQQSNPVATKLLPNPVSAYLDATVPEIWLPIKACYVFEYEFGLIYDNATQLYLVNNTLHQKLLERNASITFQLAIGRNSAENVLIELPYAAFDLTVKPPYQGVQKDSLYFPLRRAVNESQITLGRTFFQEACISVDYENQVFNVSQRVWSNNKQHLVGLPAFTGKSTYPGTNPSVESKSSSLSGGDIAGIVVGSLAVVAIIGILLTWYLRRRHQAAKRAAAVNEKLDSDAGSSGSRPASSGQSGQRDPRDQRDHVYPKAELEGSPAPLYEHEPDDTALLASGALSTQSSSGTPGSRTPNALSGSTFGRGQHRSYSPTNESPIEGNAGTGTYSSTDSSSNSISHPSGSGSATATNTNGTGTGNTLLSPISPVAETFNEADSRERKISELVGDMPSVKEKDGKELSEKEALAHREKVYNGVETPPPGLLREDTVTPDPGEEVQTTRRASREPMRKVGPGEVQIVRTSTQATTSPVSPVERRDFTRHRAFSFERDRAKAEEEGVSSEELYD